MRKPESELNFLDATHYTSLSNGLKNIMPAIKWFKTDAKTPWRTEKLISN